MTFCGFNANYSFMPNPFMFGGCGCGFPMGGYPSFMPMNSLFSFGFPSFGIMPALNTSSYQNNCFGYGNGASFDSTNYFNNFGGFNANMPSIMSMSTNFIQPNFYSNYAVNPFANISINNRKRELPNVQRDPLANDLVTNPQRYTITTPSIRNGNATLQQTITANAAKYIGCNESDRSHLQFTNGRDIQWCAAFTTHVVKESFRQQGKTIPSGFGSDSVEGLRQWGIKNGSYIQTSNKGNKAEFLKLNIKPGDLVIFKENGKSHTGIVSHIDENGTITTIEGNTSDKVAKRRYSANNNTISGFVRVA